jgi:hypothetical protein
MGVRGRAAGLRLGHMRLLQVVGVYEVPGGGQRAGCRLDFGRVPSVAWERSLRILVVSLEMHGRRD